MLCREVRSRSSRKGSVGKSDWCVSLTTQVCEMAESGAEEMAHAGGLTTVTPTPGDLGPLAPLSTCMYTHPHTFT